MQHTVIDEVGVEDEAERTRVSERDSERAAGSAVTATGQSANCRSPVDKPDEGIAAHSSNKTYAATVTV